MSLPSAEASRGLGPGLNLSTSLPPRPITGHGCLRVTACQLNLRFSTVEISYAIQSHSLIFLSHYCIPRPLYFLTLRLLSLPAASHAHLIACFLASPVQLSDVSASDLHFADPSSSLSLSIVFVSALTPGLHAVPCLPPTPATHPQTFSHSCKPAFYISPTAATQCKHYAHADTRALSISRGL